MAIIHTRGRSAINKMLSSSLMHLISLPARAFGNLTGNYGHDNILRRLTNIPSWLPINARIQHGWYANFIPDFRYKTQLMLVWNTRIKEVWQKHSTVPVYVFGSPFFRYRHYKKVNKKSNAAGTVVFPQHSSPNYNVHFDCAQYCLSLSDLPYEFKPITICVHFRDYNKYAPIFKKFGFRVVTAGHSRQGNTGFFDTFYNILSEHKYSSSNDIGSYTFYAVEMGLPFFLYGDKAVIKSKTGKIDFNNFLSTPEQYATSLFSNVTQVISDEQLTFVLNELGNNQFVETEELKRVIYRSCIKDIGNYPKRLFQRLSAKV